MELGRGKLFGGRLEIIDPELIQERKAPVIPDPLEMDQRFLGLAGVELVLVHPFEEVFVRQVSGLDGQLPVVRQILTMAEGKSPADILAGIDIPAAGDATQVVGSPVGHHITDQLAIRFVELVFGFNADADAAIAVVIDGQVGIHTLGFFPTQQPSQVPLGLNRRAKIGIMTDL